MRSDALFKEIKGDYDQMEKERDALKDPKTNVVSD